MHLNATELLLRRSLILALSSSVFAERRCPKTGCSLSSAWPTAVTKAHMDPDQAPGQDFDIFLLHDDHTAVDAVHVDLQLLVLRLVHVADAYLETSILVAHHAGECASREAVVRKLVVGDVDELNSESLFLGATLGASLAALHLSATDRPPKAVLSLFSPARANDAPPLASPKADARHWTCSATFAGLAAFLLHMICGG